MKVSIPACRSFTPAAIPPIPAPTTTTLGVPAGPNSSLADGLKSAPLRPMPACDVPGHPDPWSGGPTAPLHTSSSFPSPGQSPGL